MNTLENLTSYRDKWGLQGYTIIFLILAKKIDWGGSNEHQQTMLGTKIRKISSIII